MKESKGWEFLTAFEEIDEKSIRRLNHGKKIKS